MTLFRCIKLSKMITILSNLEISCLEQFLIFLSYEILTFILSPEIKTLVLRVINDISI